MKETENYNFFLLFFDTKSGKSWFGKKYDEMKLLS